MSAGVGKGCLLYTSNLEVLSSLTGNPGTKVKEVVKTMEKTHVSGVAKDKNVALSLIHILQVGSEVNFYRPLRKRNPGIDKWG